ncbi:MAG TPA: prenyltransferase/squalene oxidase repeat-containing protein [Isosphaeraceae bacterium]|nr:prenyltransferase/squalene oxidase repeat-containing protein [Isosphaeraceae bacterium]
MNHRVRDPWARVETRLGAWLAVVLVAQTGATIAQESKPAARPAPNSATEPFATAASMPRAAAFLDETALSWTRQHRCGTCHTNYPYLVARPALTEHPSPAMVEVRRFFEDRVAHWDDPEKAAKPRWDAEVVATAAALALNDAATTGQLHPLTRKALDRTWTLQKASGGFDWLKCGWPPYEHDDYYGAIVAALGAGNAPDGYAQSPAAQAGLARLRAYFAANPPPDLHHATMLLWASTRLDGLMTAEDRGATLARLRERQRPDGGWNLPSLGHWKRRDGTPNDPQAPSDGYATGLAVFVLRQAGVPASDPAIQRGVAWLRTHQRASGRWFTRSVNNDKYHYITHAGTAFAALALHQCETWNDDK